MILNNVTVLREGRLVKLDVYFEDSVFSIRKGLSKGRDCSGFFLLPGLVNSHVHLGSRSVSGAALGMKKYEFFDNLGFSAHKKRSVSDVYKSALLACIESLKEGVVHVDSMDVSPEPVIKACLKSGLSFTSCLALKDSFAEAGNIDSQFRHTLDLVKKYGSSVLLGFANEYECSPGLLKKGLEFARIHDLPIHMHACETLDEVKHLRKLTGSRTIDYLDSIGVLDYDSRLAHCTYVDSKDVLNLAEHEVPVMHCPSSNKAIADNAPPIKLMLDNHIPVSIGTDNYAWNPSSSVLHEAWVSHELTGVSLMQAYLLTHAVFGSGSEASFSLVDLSALKPFSSIDEFLAKLMNSHPIDVYLKGKKVIENGKNLLKINEASLRKDVEKIKKKLLA